MAAERLEDCVGVLLVQGTIIAAENSQGALGLRILAFASPLDKCSVAFSVSSNTGGAIVSYGGGDSTCKSFAGKDAMQDFPLPGSPNAHSNLESAAHGLPACGHHQEHSSQP